jgi:uncharacterized protein with ParB-like and HNH nuclease domain
MKATKVSLLEFFQQPMQIIVHDPQHDYQWTKKQCQKLWDDIVWIAENESVTSHYIGTILYIEYGILKRTPVPRLILIDGQQRLITIALLLAALGKVDNDTGKTDIRHKEINDLFLFNSQEKGEFYCKLLPAQGDRDTFFGLINNECLPLSGSNRLIKNYRYFKNKINKFGIDTDLIYRGIAKLTIIDISTDRVYENPQSVYQGLISTGLDETQTKLIRNWLGLLRSAS